jgi:hypothetical protein
MALVCNSSAGVASGGGERRSARCHALTTATAKQIYAVSFASHEGRLLPDTSIEVFHTSEVDVLLRFQNVGLISFHATELCVCSLDE